ncbi:hypothetical protein [Enterococcus hirae]|uniref:hypothetical protein n=1 Tax=Enterococcus hirae TaxID=1354 RepID=UPI001A95C5E3|nr:hypothetical protein [Enterococcus hirae]MBO1090128.1 hypothetical protein [Enterococcus hirae]
MIRKLVYFLLCLGLLTFSEKDVLAQEMGETPVLFGFSKQEKQELPDYLPSSLPERIPNNAHKKTVRLPQLNQYPDYLVLYSAGLCICLIVLRLAIRKRQKQYRGRFQ